jgi:hypothetical protein
MSVPSLSIRPMVMILFHLNSFSSFPSISIRPMESAFHVPFILPQEERILSSEMQSLSGHVPSSLFN